MRRHLHWDGFEWVHHLLSGRCNDWEDCSTSCNPGTKRRSRPVATKAEHGGAKCPVAIDNAACNEGPCPVHCEVHDWSSWTTCTKSCGGGQQERVRIVKVEA